MFHIDNFFAVWPKRGNTPIGNSRAISTRDFYLHEGHRLGLIQSMGYEANYGTIIRFLLMQFDRSRFARFGWMKKFLNIPALIASKLFGSADVFVAQMEVFPDPENRLLRNDDDPDVFRFRYTNAPDVMARQRVLRRAVRQDLDNLYVADGSFMPSSLGVNPSLTIAANALRVADLIAARHAIETPRMAEAS